MTEAVRKERPVYRNIHVTQILTYRLPLSGILSILNRITGSLLFFALPLVLLPLFEKSVTSEIGWVEFRSALTSPALKLLLLVLLWSYLHHFMAGVRYLLIDLHVMVNKQGAFKSSAVVFALSIGLTVILGLKLFGVF